MRLVLFAAAVAVPALAAAPPGEWTLGAQTRVLETFADGRPTIPAFALGLDARLELSLLLLDGAAGLVLAPGQTGLADAALAPGALFLHAAAAVLVNRTDLAAVYLGASVETRYHLAPRTLALLLSVEVGVALWRTGTHRAYLELRAGPNLLPVPIPGAPWGPSVYPVEVALGLGLGW